MIQITSGDILTADVEALVNTVNCVGVMGRGIALQFKKAFPENFKAYEAACQRNEVRPGKMFVFETGQITNPRYIINFPTKRDWKHRSRLADIDAGLVALVAEIRRLGIRSIAVPPLGCGLGGLDWNDVRPRIEKALGAVPGLQALVYAPAGAPAAADMAKTAEPPKMTVGRAALLGLMDRYLAALMDTSVSLLEMQKLMYFQQAAGENLRLRYEKAIYGPYAKNLGNVLSQIEGHFVRGYADGGDQPEKEIEAVPEAVDAAKRFLADHPSTQARFDRVVDLVEGFETPFGMELLATVHWVAAQEGAGSVDQAVALTHAWSLRKRMFSPDQIAIAWEALRRKSWIGASAAA